jgi:DNA polymerase-3 subunit beta
MKLECKKEDLRGMVAIVERATGKNQSLPALTNVLLEAKDKFLHLRSTNLEIGLDAVLPATVEKAGRLLVNGAVLNSFLANLYSGEKVSLETAKENLLVSSAGNASTIKTFPADDFPNLPEIEATTKFNLPARLLTEALRTIVYSASLSDIKPEIASVYIYSEAGDLYLVATDSFRLAEKKIPLPVVEGVKMIVPIKNITELIRVFDGFGGELEISYNNHQLAVRGGGIYFTSRLIEGVFPDYRQIMPTGTASLAVVLKSDLQNALRLTSIFSDRLHQISLHLKPSAAVFELRASNNEVGETATKLPATLQGEDLELSLNIRYLLDCLPALTTDSVSLGFNGKNRPLLISAVGDNSFHYLIMPLNR